jgi:hypothetical protein
MLTGDWAAASVVTKQAKAAAIRYFLSFILPTPLMNCYIFSKVLCNGIRTGESIQALRPHNQ